jgi:hypothetical protein
VKLAVVIVVALVACACATDAGGGAADAAAADAGPSPGFPADYAASYTEVRDCRGSADHLLNRIRVLADPAALAPYRDRQAPFPDGAVVLKVEHDQADCGDAPIRWTVMIKNAAATERLGWDWQDVAADRTVTASNPASCAGCHSVCDGDPLGYDGTCADE